MTQKFDSVEKRIIKALRGLQEKAGSNDDKSEVWTRIVKNEIGQIGTSLGYDVYASSCESAKDGEWLFDLTWAYYESEYLKSIPLALECEWSESFKEVIDDFCKLMVSRADYRVMVFYANNKALANKKIEQLIDEVVNSHLTENGDRYLFACWIENDDKFYFRSYVAS